jgi:hypothetical protein
VPTSDISEWTFIRGAMSLNTLWRRLIRRPFVLMVILAVTALATYAGWSSTDSQAEFRTAVLVIPPWSFESELFPNPVLNLGERTTALASAITTAVQTNDVMKFVAESGATGYKVSNLGDNLRDPRPSAVIQFVVTGPNQQAARDGADRLIVRSRQILVDMQHQSGVGDPQAMAKLHVIVQPQEIMSAPTRRVRAAAVFGVAVFITAILLFWGIESILGRRSRSSDRGSKDSLKRREDQSLNSDDRSSDTSMSPARQPT